MVVELQVPFPWRRSFQLANDLVRTLAWPRRHPDFPSRRPTQVNGGCPLSNRTWLDDRAIHRPLDRSAEMAAGGPNADFVRRLHHRALRRNKPAAVRSSRGGDRI